MKTTQTFSWAALILCFLFSGQSYCYAKKASSSTIEVLTPNGGERFQRGQHLVIRWRDASASEKVIIYINDKQITETENDGVFEWEVPVGYALGSYKVKVLNYNGEDDSSDGEFMIFSTCTISSGHEAVEDKLIENRYYTTLYTKKSARVLQTKGRFLNFVYNEHYDVTASKNVLLNASIFDFRNNELLHLELNKKRGKNYYSIDLSKGCNAIGYEKQVYILKVKNANNRESQLKFRLTPDEGLTANIAYDAESWDCDETGQTEISFQADITGGTAPYRVEWSVSPTSSEVQAIYQEKDQATGSYNDVPAQITVLENPGYYLIMVVKDFCGQEVRKTLNVQCGQKKTPKSSLLFQLIDQPQNQSSQ